MRIGTLPFRRLGGASCLPHLVSHAMFHGCTEGGNFGITSSVLKLTYSTLLRHRGHNGTTTPFSRILALFTRTKKHAPRPYHSKNRHARPRINNKHARLNRGVNASWVMFQLTCSADWLRRRFARGTTRLGRWGWGQGRAGGEGSRK